MAVSNHLIEQIVALLRTARLTDQLDFAVFNGDDWLDGKKASDNGCCSGDASAFFQIFQRVEQRDDLDILLDTVKLGCELGCRQILRDQSFGIVDKNRFTKRDIHTVDHKRFTIEICCGDACTLVSAGELGRKRDGHGRVTLRNDIAERLLKSKRRNLACDGKAVGLNQNLVKLFRRNIHAGQILFLTDGYGERKIGHIVFFCVRNGNVRSGIDD